MCQKQQSGWSRRYDLRFLCGLLFFFLLLFTAGAVAAWADTCSYTYHCSSSACAQMMGGWSGTRSQAGITKAQCEQAREATIAGGSEPCTCSSGDSAAPAGGDVHVATGTFQQNMVSLGANAMVMNIKNPYVSNFMFHATNSFLQTMFDNQAEAQRQRQIMEQQLAVQQQEQERERRIAEQQRFDAMFERLNRQLKLEGVPFGLSLKNMTTETDLQLKAMNAADPGALKLKLSNSTPTSYGLKGLPGIYVGGPAGGDAQADAGTAGNPNLASGPGTGTTGPGIPGLPGIYLDNVQPNQAPQLAAAAEKLSGPERDMAQDAALQAAQQNPALNAPSQNPQVQDFQQSVQAYDQAAVDAKSSQQQLTDAQARVDADHSMLDMARSKMDTMNATQAQQAAYGEMVAAAKTDEDAAVAARQMFDNANVKLSAARSTASTSLASFGPGADSSQGTMLVDLRHSPSTTPANLKLAGAGSPPERAAALAVAARGTTKPAPQVASLRSRDLPACIATVAGHPAGPGSALPTPEQLRKQIEEAQEAIRQLVENHEKEDALREEADERVQEAVDDAKKQAFDLTMDYALHQAQVVARSGLWKAGAEVEELEKMAAAEKDAAGAAQLQAKLEQATARRENLKQAMEVLEKAKQKVEEGTRLRDYDEFASKDPKELEQAQGYLEGVKQLVQAALAENRVKAALQFTPYVDSTVKWGSSLIDTSYDLLSEFYSSRQLEQLNHNSDQYLKALDALNRRVKVSVQQLNCYKGTGVRSVANEALK